MQTTKRYTGAAVAALLLVTVLGAGGCEFPTGDEGVLTLNKTAVAVRIGQTATVEIGRDYTSVDEIADVGLLYDEDLFSAAASGTHIEIHGISLGTSELTVQVGSESAVVTVRVYDPKYIEASGLMITFCDDFELLWWDKGSGGSHNGSYWQPQPEEGFYALGSYGKSEYGNPSGTIGVIVVKDCDPSRQLLAAPADYERIWTDAGSGADMDGSFWRPIPPGDDYVAMGAVAQLGGGETLHRPGAVCAQGSGHCRNSGRSDMV